MGVGLGMLIGAGLTILFQKVEDLKKQNNRLSNENKELKEDLNRANHYERN
jgi:FtsZ-binding cell division protein ZapB